MPEKSAVSYLVRGRRVLHLGSAADLVVTSRRTLGSDPQRLYEGTWHEKVEQCYRPVSEPAAGFALVLMCPDPAGVTAGSCGMLWYCGFGVCFSRPWILNTVQIRTQWCREKRSLNEKITWYNASSVVAVLSPLFETGGVHWTDAASSYFWASS